MTNYKYKIVFSTKFKKMLKKIQKQNINLEELFIVIDKLANKELLDIKYKNYNLVNDKHYKNCYECHIRPELLLIYQYNDEKLLLLLINVGSHSELFKWVKNNKLYQ